MWQGREDDSGGVGMLVAEDLASSIQCERRINDRNMLVSIILDKRLVHFISAYTPQVGRSADDMELLDMLV